MAAAEIGASASGYTGNAGLGGGSFGSFQLDVKPIEDLARYTMLYNKAEYDQRQKDAEKASAEIADMTSYDLTTGIPKDAKLLQEKYDKLTSYVRDNPNALDYRNKKEWAEYKKMRNDLDNDLKGAKVRNTMWALRQKEVQDEKNPKEKVRLQQKLDKDIADTDIRTPLKYSDQFDLKPISVTAAQRKKVEVTEIGKNFVGQESWDLPDMDNVQAQAAAISTGLSEFIDFEKTDSFLSKTPEEQNLLREQYKAQSSSGKLEPVQSAENFNSAIKVLVEAKDNNGNFLYKNSDGTYNIQKIIDDGKDPFGLLQQVSTYNQSMDQMVSAINNKWFKDDFGNELKFTNDASGLKKSSYKKISLEDGLSPEELIKIRILAISGASSRTIKVDETDLEVKKGNLAQGWYEAKTGRINANKPSGGLPTTVSGGIQTPAILFGEHINRLKNWFSSNGGNSMSVTYDAIDEKTRGALKIQSGERVQYNNDGSFVIQVGDDKSGWTNARVGTIEDLKQGFINVVKGGMSSDGSQTKEFQDESEQGFNSIFGTTSGSIIFNGWGKPATTAPNGAKTETPQERAIRIANEK